MQPELILTPFGENANPGTINDIPESLNPSDPVQSASWQAGFPLVTMTPLSAGGIPPRGQDVNGALRAISRHSAFLGGGGQYKWSSAYVAAKGGYSIGDVIQANDGLNSYVSLVNSNSVDFNSSPSSIGTSWSLYSGRLLIQTQATEDVPGIAKIATSVLASAGADNSTIMTPLKVKGVLPTQATETNLGLLRIATLPQVQAGTVIDLAVTPSTLKAVLPTQATETNLGLLRIATLPQVQAGTGIDLAVTPSTLKAVLPVQATETILGLLKIATLPQAQAGTETMSAITPSTLRSLFPKRSFSENDYIRIPDVPGGLIIQFGIASLIADGNVTTPMPIAFPNFGLAAFVTLNNISFNTGSDGAVGVAFATKSTLTIRSGVATSSPAFWLAIGY